MGRSKPLISNITCMPSLVLQCRLSSEEVPKKRIYLNGPDHEQPYTLTEEQMHEITAGDSEKQLKLNELLLKLFIRYEQGQELPENIKLESFETMLYLGNNQLTRTLRNFVKHCKESKKQLALKKQNQLNLEEARANRETTESSWLDYKVSHNCLFLRLYQRSIAAAYNVYAIQGMQFGQNLIFDCSMESKMWDKELKQTVKQILLCYDTGRRTKRPFALHLCNLNFNGRLMKHLKVQRPDIFDLPIGLHSVSYLDLFERKKLVYIDQRVSKKLVYNPEDIYIFQAFPDRHGTAPLALKIASKENIQYASLPIDDYVNWKPNVMRYICLNQFHDILLDVKNHRNWPKAIEASLPKSRYESVKPKWRKDKN